MEGGISDLMEFPWQEGQTGGDRLPMKINLIWEVEQANQEHQGPEKKPIKQQLRQGKQSLRWIEWDSFSCSALQQSVSALPWIGRPRSFSISLRTWILRDIESPGLGGLITWVSEFISPWWWCYLSSGQTTGGWLFCLVSPLTHS